MTSNNATLYSLNATDVVTDSTTVGIMYLVTSLLVMLSNSIVMVVVITSRELHLPTLWNIAFMALCDFSYGLHYMVFAVPSAFMKRFAYPEGFIAPASCILTLLFGQNVLNTVVATIDRYIYVKYPLRYNQLMSSKRFIITITITVIITITITVIINVCRLCLIIFPKVDVHYNPILALCESKFNTTLSVLASVAVPAISLVLIVVFLSKMIMDIRRSQHRTAPVAYKQKNVACSVTIILSAGTFCLSYLPSCVLIVWNVISGPESVPISLLKFGIICLLSNRLWNVVIYATTYRPFRHAFLCLFFKEFYRKKRQSEVHAIFKESHTL